MTIGTQNTVSFVWRHKYYQSALQQALRNTLVSKEIFKWDTSGLKTIENPYISTDSTVTIQAVAGTYSSSAPATTEDSLIVADEVIAAPHVFDFESRFSNFNLVADFLDNAAYQVAYTIDKFALNKVLSLATGTYTTPAGGFTNPSNIAKIMGDLYGKIGGVQGVNQRPFLVIEKTDLTGFVQFSIAAGTNYADAALNNGFSGQVAGVDVYVVNSSTFVTATLGTLSATNSGRRLFGIKNMALCANPGGVNYKELDVPAGTGTGRTGKEIVQWGYIGAKVWAPQASLFVNITLA